MIFSDNSGELAKLRRQRRRDMSEEDLDAMRDLPSTLVALEESITEIATEMGGDAFRDMPELKGLYYNVDVDLIHFSIA